MKETILRCGLIAIVFSLLVATEASAQLTVGADLALPMGSPFSDTYNPGYGGALGFGGLVNDNLGWTGSIGYQSYSVKSPSSGTTGLLPLQVGLKYYFTEYGNGWYGEFDLGMYFVSTMSSSLKNKIGVTPAIGYRIASFDIGVRYNLISDLNNLTFRVAYVVGN